MTSLLERLRRGERWWAAEIALRTIGLALFCGSYWLGLLAHGLVSAPPPHQATPAEFAICGTVFLALTSGLALTLFGPGLFQEVPIPPRSAWYWKKS